MTTPALAGTPSLRKSSLDSADAPSADPKSADPKSADSRSADSRSARGRTTLSDRVVDKIAAGAALEVDHVHGASRGIAGSVFNSAPAVGATATIDGHLAQVQLVVEVDYPVSLRAVTRQLRTHVSERVRQLCDITVTDVDVRIAALRYATEPVRRVL